MKSVNVGAFFSCSFSPDDGSVNELFHSICRALDVRCSNIATAFAATPPEAAKTMIADSQALIAVCTKRDMLASGQSRMPSAVHEELSFAFGKDIPVLMFVEEGIELSGFLQNFGTNLRFKRDELSTAAVIEKIVSAIHTLKLQLIQDDGSTQGHGPNEFYAEVTRFLIEMKERDGDYYWEYSSTRKLNFLKSFKGSIPTGAWTRRDCKIPAGSPLIVWGVAVDKASSAFDIKTTIESHTPESVEVLLKFEPAPREGESVEYSQYFASRYLNPIWNDDLQDKSALLHLSTGDYRCFDGFLPVQRTKTAHLVFRFPRSYGLAKEEVTPFVGSYTSTVDYEVESELERIRKNITSIGGNLEVTMSVDSPLLGHLYGLAWNPKHRRVNSTGT